MFYVQCLRSTDKPQFRREGSSILVWTECGQETNACFVDNETTNCFKCERATR